MLNLPKRIIALYKKYREKGGKDELNTQEMRSLNLAARYTEDELRLAVLMRGLYERDVWRAKLNAKKT